MRYGGKGAIRIKESDLQFTYYMRDFNVFFLAFKQCVEQFVYQDGEDLSTKRGKK